MITITMTIEQLDALRDVVNYVMETEYTYHDERLQEGEDVSNDIYIKAVELSSVEWKEIT